MNATLGVVLLLNCAVTVAARAQDVDPATFFNPARTCVSTIPPAAFTRVVVYAFVDVPASVSQGFASAADGLLQELVTRSQRLLGAQDNVLPRGKPTVLWTVVTTTLHLTAYRNGRVAARGVKPSDSSAASLMARALDSVSTFSLMAGTEDSVRDSIGFDIDFVRPVVDSAGDVTPPPVKRDALPLLSEAVPWYRPVIVKPNQPPPRYPLEARKRNLEASIMLTFIVDTTGHAIASTIRDVSPRQRVLLAGEDLEVYHRFVEASKQGVLGMDFIPASIGGCKLNQVAQMPFVFGLNRSGSSPPR